MNKKNNRKGFTIVELVIVIAVIAILATVLVPTFGNIIEKAQKSSSLQEAKNTYTNYVANVNYADGLSAAEDVIIKAGKYYVVVADGSVTDEAFETYAEALKTFEDYTVTENATSVTYTAGTTTEDTSDNFTEIDWTVKA